MILGGDAPNFVVYEQDEEGIRIVEFKLSFDNYSRFIFIDEAGIMVDTICQYCGWYAQEDFELARKRIIAGDTGASINWRVEGALFTLKVDTESHRPELIVKINVQ